MAEEGILLTASFVFILLFGGDNVPNFGERDIAKDEDDADVFRFDSSNFADMVSQSVAETLGCPEKK